MIRPDAKLDLDFLKNNIISRATAGHLVQGTETTYGNGQPLSLSLILHCMLIMIRIRIKHMLNEFRMVFL